MKFPINFIFLSIIVIIESCNNYQKPNNTIPLKTDLLFVDTLKDCKSAVRLAIKDFKEGNFKVIRYGLEGDPDFFIPYFKNKYKIQLLYGGCISSRPGECYTETMDSLLFNMGINIKKEIFELRMRNKKSDTSKTRLYKKEG